MEAKLFKLCQFTSASLLVLHWRCLTLTKHSILLRPFPLTEESDAPTKNSENQIVDMVDICFSKGYQDYAIHSVQLICVQFSYTYVYANYTHIIQIHIHILSDIYIYRYLLYIFFQYIFFLMDFSHQIHGGPIFHSVGTEQRQCSCEAAARSSQGIPGQQQHKEASCARHQILMKRKGGGFSRKVDRLTKKNTYKHQQKHVFFFSMLAF